MLVAVMAYFFLPWLDRSPVKSIRYRGWMFKLFLGLFTISFLGLMYLGMQPAQGIYIKLRAKFDQDSLAQIWQSTRNGVFR